MNFGRVPELTELICERLVPHGKQVALLWQRDRATRLSVEILQLQKSHLKTRVPGLSCGIICMILRLAVFVQYRSVTETHRRTDGRTDRA